MKDLVARTLHGQSWDEAALDRVLANIDANVGPSMVDASAFLHSTQTEVPPTGLAPVSVTLDPLLQYFVEAEKKYIARH